MQYYLLNPYIRRVMMAVVADALCLVAASAITWVVLAPAFSPVLYASATALIAIGSFVTLYYCDAYNPSVLGSGRETLTCVANAMGMAFLGALVIYFLVPTPDGVVRTLAHVAALYFPFLLSERLGFRIISSLPQFSHRVVVIGASDLGIAIAEVIRRAKEPRPRAGRLPVRRPESPGQPHRRVPDHWQGPRGRQGRRLDADRSDRRRLEEPQRVLAKKVLEAEPA